MTSYRFTYMLGDDLTHVLVFPAGYMPAPFPERGDFVSPFAMEMPSLPPRRVVERVITYGVDGSNVLIGIVLLTEAVPELHHQLAVDEE